MINKNIRLINKYLDRQWTFQEDYSIKKTTKAINYSFMSRKYRKTKNTIDKINKLKGETKLKFERNFSIYCDEMNYHRQKRKFSFEEDLFSNIAHSNTRIMHEVLLMMNFLHTKPQIKDKNKIYNDLFYAINI